MRLGERLIQIGDDIFYVFDSDGNAHHTIGDADGLPSLLSQRGVSHGGRMGDQSFDSAQRFSRVSTRARA